MAVIINATTTTGLTTSADNSGVIQFQSNGANTVGISSTGYLTVGGNQQIYGPSFSAYQSSAQTISSATATKVAFQTELWDTNNNYDNSTYRFTPTVAGYYQVNAIVHVGVSATSVQTYIYKNGSNYKSGPFIGITNASLASGVVYCNGSTDYIEVYVYFGTGQAISNSQPNTYFDATMIRGA